MARSASAPTAMAPLRGEAVGAGGVGGDEIHAALQGEAVSRAFGEDEGVDQGRPAESGQRLPEVALLVGLGAAGVVGADPIYLAAHDPPERCVGVGSYGRVDLAALVVVGLVGERQVMQRRLEPHVEVGVQRLQLQRRIERLLAREVQEVYGAARVTCQNGDLRDGEVLREGGREAL